MITKEPDNPRGEVEACDWCRMGLHKKCIKRTRSLQMCICDCERGY